MADTPEKPASAVLPAPKGVVARPAAAAPVGVVPIGEEPYVGPGAEATGDGGAESYAEAAQEAASQAEARGRELVLQYPLPAVAAAAAAGALLGLTAAAVFKR